MADGLFDQRAHFTESAVIFDDFEQRVVAEAAAAGRLEANSPATLGVAFGTNRSRRIGDRTAASTG